MNNIPNIPKNAFRVILTVTSTKPRIDQVLIEELRKQSISLPLKTISRTEFKELFKKKRIRIKGQACVPSSSLAKGTTYVDILGFGGEDQPIAVKKTESPSVDEVSMEELPKP
jgi:hypothetical protein